MTESELYQLAQRLSQDIDNNRWEFARAASEARDSGIVNYIEIIRSVVKRSPSTISHWAHTWDVWKDGDRTLLPYSFYETASRYSDRLDLDDIAEVMAEYYRDGTATIEAFRAELATLAGADTPDPIAVFRNKLQACRDDLLQAVDAGSPTARCREFVLAAATALADALGEFEKEKV